MINLKNGEWNGKQVTTNILQIKTDPPTVDTNAETLKGKRSHKSCSQQVVNVGT